jgi:hypothetical protein
MHVGAVGPVHLLDEGPAVVSPHPRSAPESAASGRIVRSQHGGCTSVKSTMTMPRPAIPSASPTDSGDAVLSTFAVGSKGRGGARGAAIVRRKPTPARWPPPQPLGGGGRLSGPSPGMPPSGGSAREGVYSRRWAQAPGWPAHPDLKSCPGRERV